MAHFAARCKEPATRSPPPSPAAARRQRGTLLVHSLPSLGTMEGGEAELGRGSSFASYLIYFANLRQHLMLFIRLFHSNFCDSSFFAIFFTIIVDEYCAICATSFFVHLHVRTRPSYNFFLAPSLFVFDKYYLIINCVINFYFRLLFNALCIYLKIR